MDTGKPEKPTIELNYTPRTVKEVEDRFNNKSIALVMSEHYSIGAIVILLQKGAGVDENGAYNLFEKYLNAGGEQHELWIAIMEKLQSQGFLPRAVNIQEELKVAEES